METRSYSPVLVSSINCYNDKLLSQTCEMCKRDCQLFVTPMVSIPSAATRKFLCTASSTSRSMCSLSVPFGWERNRSEHCCQNRSIFETENIAHTNWWRRKILKNLRWVFLEAPTKMKALTIFTAIQWTELIFAFELRLTKTVGKQPKKTRASRRILHVASWLDQVVFDQYLRGMGSRGVQALIFPGLSSAISFTAA